MKRFKLLLLFGLIGILLSSCKGKDPYSEMADAMCKCMKPMAEMYNKIEQLSTSGNTQELQALMGQLEQTAEEAEECTGRMEEKYGEPEDEEKAKETLKKACPEVAAIMEKAEEGFE